MRHRSGQLLAAPRFTGFYPAPPPAVTAPTPVDRARVALDDGDGDSPALLSYQIVLARSGLPAGLDGRRATLPGMVGDLDDWHQLDHYTAANVVLDARQRPLALVLQQHNYQHTKALDESFVLGDERRPARFLGRTGGGIRP